MRAVCRGCACFLLSLLTSFVLPAAPPAVRAQALTATWARGNLVFTIPCRAPRAGTGVLVLELLDPGDKVLAETERRADVPAGDVTWTEDLTVPSSLPFDDLVWERVRWRFTYNGETADSAHSRTERLYQRRASGRAARCLRCERRRVSHDRFRHGAR